MRREIYDVGSYTFKRTKPQSTITETEGTVIDVSATLVEIITLITTGSALSENTRSYC